MKNKIKLELPPHTSKPASESHRRTYFNTKPFDIILSRYKQVKYHLPCTYASHAKV